MIRRKMADELKQAASEYPVVTVLGPRQSGKTTLVKMTFPKKAYRSLEEPDVRMIAQDDPRGFLSQFPKGVILDEIQRAPDLLSYIQGIVDEKRGSGRFILTGSHQPAVHRAVGQTLAGRTSLLKLFPLSRTEIARYGKADDPFSLIAAGMYPRVYEEDLAPRRFFSGYVQTYLERDVRSLIQVKDLRRFQQFLQLLAGRVGQLVNYSALAGDVGVSSTTIKDWISVLQASYVVFELPPYFENIKKRVLKSPKIYFCDPGLASHLMGITTAKQAARDPLRGSLYENLVLLEVLKARCNRGLDPNLYFYRDAAGREVDLLIRKEDSLIPIEIKSAATFHREFQEGIRRFREIAGNRVAAGSILYNGGRDFTYRDTRIFNPLKHEGLEDLAL